MSSSVTANSTAGMQKILDAMTGADRQPATRADVQALAYEVAELRALLTPSRSPIITGAEAVRAYADIRKAPQ